MLYIRNKTNEVHAALQFTGENITQIVQFAGRHVYLVKHHEDVRNREYMVETPNGERPLYIGDYVVMIDERFYTRGSQWFDKNYESLNGPDPIDYTDVIITNA